MTTPLHVACYGDLRAWFRRRRRAILLTAGALGAGCLLYYGITRYRPSSSLPRGTQEPDSQDEQEVPEQQQLRQHFQGIQSLADTTTLPPLLTRFKDALFRLIDISEITRQLLAGKEGPQALNQAEKLQLWQKVKILSFTRAVSAAFGIALSHLLIRTQLNILGRRMFISTARDQQQQQQDEEAEEEEEESAAAGIPLEVQHSFMAVSDYFPDHGFKILARDAEDAVNKVLGDVSLKNLYTFDELRGLFVRIREVFEDQRHDWTRYLLPEDSSSSSPEADGELVALVGELRQVVSSPEYRAALAAVLDTLLGFMMQELQSQYENSSSGGLPLAKLVPSVSSRGTLLERSEYDKYVAAVAELPQVESFCLLVYGSPGV